MSPSSYRGGALRIFSARTTLRKNFRGLVARALCGLLLLQSSPALATAIPFREEPLGWRSAVKWTETAGTDLTADLVRGRIAWGLAVRVALARLAQVDGAAHGAAASSQSPPDPPGFRTVLSAVAGPRVLPAAAGDIPLLPGWNLISLPVRPLDGSPAVVFETGAQRVFAYDACDPVDPWKVHDPSDPTGSDLTEVDETLGLWVETASGGVVPAIGELPVSTTIHLCPGWNLIGFPAGRPRTVQSALASIAGKYRRIFGYDPSDAADPWEIHDVAVPVWANDLKQLLPGRGYWLLATEETDLEIAGEGLQLAVSLRQPEQLAVVTGPRDVVGTVQGQDLESWELRARAVGSEEWQVLGSGTSAVTDVALGHFDPTLRLNGLYELELAAYGAGDSGVAVSTHVVVDGFRKIGHFSLSFIDLEIPLAGVPIRVLRTYDSRDRESRDFGHGWTLDVKQGSYRNNRTPGEGWRIVTGFLPCQVAQETLPHLTTVRLSDAEVYRFRFRLNRPALTAGGCFAEAGFDFVDGRFPGATLTVLGSKEVFWANGSSRAVDVSTQEPYEPRAVRLRTRDGREFDLDLVEGITRLADRNGNALNLTPDGITHSTGQSIPFERDSQGRIVRIADPEGEQIEYTYDARGDLAAVTDRETRVSRFGYDDDHFLLTVEDPRGSQAIRNEYDDSGRLIRSTDAEGKTVELTHDLDNQREVVLDRLGHRRVMEYDDRGNVVREIDPLGKVTARTYDANDLLLTETDPLGNTFTYTYDAARNRTASQDPLGNRTAFTYDARGQVLTETDPRGKTTTYAYDDRGNPVSETGPLGFVTTYTHDGRGNVLSRTDAEGAVTSWEYDSLGRAIVEVDPLGARTLSEYSSNGNLILKTAQRTTPAGVETLTWTYTYDDLGRLIEVTLPDGATHRTVYDEVGAVAGTYDALNRRTSLTHDDLGRLLEKRYPDGTTERHTYDAEGRPLTRTDRGGRITSFVHDPAGRLIRTVLPDGAEILNGYDDAGRLVAVTDERGKITRSVYDRAGQLIGEQDALGRERTFAYDAAGRQISMTDARGNTTSFEYDDAGQMIGTIQPGQTETRMSYDKAGRRTAETDAAGRATRFTYDRRGQLLAVTDAANQVTSYAYDEQGYRVSQTDANGRETRFEHDPLGRVIRRSLPGGAAEVFSYNAMGNRISRTDFKGVTTRFEYDSEGRLTERQYPDGSTVRFTYTATGMRSSAADRRGRTSYEYDDRDRLTRLIDPAGREILYSYDAVGNRITRALRIDGTVRTTNYGYDDLGRVHTVTDPEGQVYTYGRDENGNRASVLYPNGARASYVFDSLDRLTALTVANAAGATLLNQAYMLGPSGLRTQIADQDGTTRSYSYDSLDRLTGESTKRSGAPLRSEAFSYDAVGNRVSRSTSTPEGESSESSTHDARDRVQEENGLEVSWDENGNQLERAGARYAWDFENRLARIELADGRVVRHDYDADGNLWRTEVADPSGAVRTAEYLTDPREPLPQVLAEWSSATEGWTWYVLGDERLALRREGPAGDPETRYFHADGLGSIRALTDGEGRVTDEYVYAAFGELLSHFGEDPQSFLFAGEAHEPVTGLSYNRARWLDLRQGRFISQDPFEGLPLDPRTLHLYSYALSDPVNRTDPSGYLSNFIYGREVHEAIGEDFVNKGLNRDYDLAISTILRSRVPLIGRLRPDLIDFGKRQIYEIKTIRQVAEGRHQLTGYLLILNWANPNPNHPWTAGNPWDYTPPPILTLKGWGVYAQVSPPILGLILYDVYDFRQIITVLVTLALYSSANQGTIIQGQAQMAAAMRF
jgi:RHS repeat-associated protein